MRNGHTKQSLLSSVQNKLGAIYHSHEGTTNYFPRSISLSKSAEIDKGKADACLLGRGSAHLSQQSLFPLELLGQGLLLLVQLSHLLLDLNGVGAFGVQEFVTQPAHGLFLLLASILSILHSMVQRILQLLPSVHLFLQVQHRDSVYSQSRGVGGACNALTRKCFR